MVTITNISANPLLISDGKYLASGDSRHVETANDRDRKFQTRDWLMITDDEPAAAPAAPPAPPKSTTPAAAAGNDNSGGK